MRSLPRLLFGCLFVALLALGFTLLAFQATAATNNALDFDGVDDHVVVSNASAAIAGAAAFSLSGWVNATKSTVGWGNYDGFFGFRNDVDADFYLVRTSDTSLEARFRNSSGAFYDVIVTNTVVTGWHYWTLTYDGTNLTLYRDGASLGATPATGTFTNATTLPLYLGRLDYAANQFWLQGQMDNVTLWTKALSAAEVQTTMATISGTETGLAVFYDFDQGTAGGTNSAETTLLDRAGVALNGTLTNFALTGTTSNWVSGPANTTPPPTVTPVPPTVTPTNTATPTPVVPSGCTQGIVGIIEADNGFCPDRDGFAFGNFGDTLNPDAATLIDMYGADAICKRGTLSADGTDCTVDVSVRALIASRQRTTYGNAYGMSVTSLRLFTAQDEQPAQFDPTASTSFALPFSRALSSYINRFSAQQFSVRTGAQGDSGYLRALLPESLLARITTELQRPRAIANPVLLLLYARDGASSHTLVPYRLVNVGPNQFDLYVYDANFPGDNSRKVRFDLAAATWSYSTTLAALGKIIDLSGDSTSSALPDLRYLSAHALRGLVLLGTSATLTTTTQTLLATGNPVAYETNNCHDLSIGGTVITTLAQSNPGCNAVASTGTYQSLAFSDGFSAEDSNRSQNRIAGVGGANTAAGDLTFDLAGNQGSGGMSLDLLTDQGDLTQISAAPAGVSSAGIASTTAVSYGLKLSPDASTVSMSATGPTGATTAVVANLGLLERGRTANQPSISVTVQGIPLALGQPLQTKLDATTGLFTLTSDRPIVVALQIERLAPDGHTATFENSNVVIAGVAAQLNFGAWTGGRTPLSIIVDKTGDGFANDTPQTLENRYGLIYLPIVRVVR
ncbi:MAG: LamG domain-containing protein [Chloroflexales bacterium]